MHKGTNDGIGSDDDFEFDVVGEDAIVGGEVRPKEKARVWGVRGGVLVLADKEEAEGKERRRRRG